MLIRSARAWIAAAVVAAVVALLVADSGKEPEAPAKAPALSTPPAEQAPARIERSLAVAERAPTPRAASSAGRLLPTAEAPFPIPTLTVAAPSEGPHGQVQGGVFAIDGRGLAGERVALLSPRNGGTRLNALTDDDGRFAFERVPVGNWTLEHQLQRPPLVDRMTGYRGSVEVRENQATWVPIQLEGERSLSGRLTMDLERLGLANQAGTVLLLALTPRWDRDAPVAVARLRIFEEPPSSDWRRDPEEVARHLTESGDYELMARIDPHDPATWPEPELEPRPRGVFRFTHLVAGPYLLRVTIEGNETGTLVIEGQRVTVKPFAEWGVDLTLADIELPERELDFEEDFLAPAYERHLAEVAAEGTKGTGARTPAEGASLKHP